MKILVTGFEPFGGAPANPSEQVVMRLQDISIPGIDLATYILPVDQNRSAKKLIEEFEVVGPDAILSLGEAPRKSAISVERVAINLMDYRIPDNQGNQVTDQPVIPGGPAAYFATLPARKIFEKLCLAGIPAEFSLSAGSFLCNQVLYEILHYLNVKRLSKKAGFIHLPSLPEQAALLDPQLPGMDLETALKGVLLALEGIRENLVKGDN